MEHLERVNKKFRDVAYHQEMKGIKKYGQPLNPLDDYDWLGMALEEQVDGTKYLVAEMEKRKFIVNEIRKLLKHKSEWVHYDEIIHWLDVLEGKNRRPANETKGSKG